MPRARQGERVWAGARAFRPDRLLVAGVVMPGVAHGSRAQLGVGATWNGRAARTLAGTVIERPLQ